ncbi:MAG: hypothetical protein ACR2PR_08065 [Pseudohongiellaceae bacterium]
MTDSAINASQNESMNLGPTGILKQVEAYAQENPTATEYWIDNEFAAAAILSAMAASLKHVRKTTGTLAGAEAAELKKFEQIYRHKCAVGEALLYFRTIDDDEALEIFGLRIRAHRLIVN